MSSNLRIYSSDDGRFQVVFPRNLEFKILGLCSVAQGWETGGVLVGNYTPDCLTAIIMNATPPPKDSDAGRTWFHRGVAGLQRLFARLWSKPKREYYIGEWHYYPTSIVAPSPNDVHQMKNISRRTEKID